MGNVHFCTSSVCGKEVIKQNSDCREIAQDMLVSKSVTYFNCIFEDMSLFCQESCTCEASANMPLIIKDVSWGLQSLGCCETDSIKQYVLVMIFQKGNYIQCKNSMRSKNMRSKITQVPTRIHFHSVKHVFYNSCWKWEKNLLQGCFNAVRAHKNM